MISKQNYDGQFFSILDFSDVGPEKRLSARLPLVGGKKWGSKKKVLRIEKFRCFHDQRKKL